MTKRIAFVSYSDSNVTQYNIKFRTNTTESVSESGVHTEVSEITEGSGGISVRIGSERINLSPTETEALLTTLLAHQRRNEGYNLELYKKD